MANCQASSSYRYTADLHGSANVQVGSQGFNTRSVCVRFMVVRVALKEVFLKVLLLYPVSIILLMLDIHISFFCLWRSEQLTFFHKTLFSLSH
jgi:hypothetical protein